MSNIEEILRKCDNCKLNECDGCITYSDMQVIKARIKELEEERQLVGMPVKNKRSGKIGIVLHKWENGSIAVLENISPRIINTHDNWDTLEIINDEIKQIKTGSDSIPKQKVKDVLQNNRNEIFSFTYVDDEQFKPYTMQIDRINKIEKELLEEGE